MELPKAPLPPDYKLIKETSDKKLAQEAAEEAERLRLDALRSSCEATGGTLEAETCVLPPPPPEVPYTAPEEPTQQSYSWYGLIGSLGYALPYGNCVNEPGVNNPGWGNPIEWPIFTTTPSVGATALFWFNHVAVVTGLWDNGDIEIRHQNCPGCPTRYPRSEFRGFR